MAGTENPVVIDVGSESVKAGYAMGVPTEHEPRLVAPSLVVDDGAAAAAGGSRRGAGGAGAGAGGAGAGAGGGAGGRGGDGGDDDEPWAQRQARLLREGRARRPVVRGKVADWDAYDALLDHVLYDRLGWIRGEEGAALFVEPLFVGKHDRERLCQLLFEGYNVAGLFVHDAAALSLFAAGKLTGIVADLGHGKVDVASVADGVTNAPGALRLRCAGEDVTRYLGRLLQQQKQQGQQQPHLTPTQLGHLKALCCAAPASAEQLRALLSGAPLPPLPPKPKAKPAAGLTTGGLAAGPAAPSTEGVAGFEDLDPAPGGAKTYTLPDGATITVTTEGLQACEALFEPGPALGGGGAAAAPGLVDALLQVIADLPDPATRRAALADGGGVVLVGGGAAARGLATRVRRELRVGLPSALSADAAAPGAGVQPLPEYMLLQAAPQLAPWVGGAVMAKMATYQGHFLSRAEYQELGPSVVHRKCA